MDIITMQPVFFLTSVRVEKKIFETLAFFAYLVPPVAPQGVRAMNSTIYSGDLKVIVISSF